MAIPTRQQADYEETRAGIEKKIVAAGNKTKGGNKGGKGRKNKAPSDD